MKIIFIRHGKTNLKTNKLNMLGYLQIKNSLSYIKQEKVDCIFCSPQTSTLQTANILNKKFKAPLLIWKEFDEREQLTLDQEKLYAEDFKENYFNYAYKNTNFTTCRNFIDRCFSGFEKIFEKSKELNTVIIVGHNSTFYALNTYINKIPKTQKINYVNTNFGSVVKFYI